MTLKLTTPAPIPETRILAYRCVDCGSRNITVRHAAHWSAAKQAWVSDAPAETDEVYTCQDCGEESYAFTPIFEAPGGQTEAVHLCGPCDWVGYFSELRTHWPDIPGLAERVAPGEPCPSGECPSCGGLTQPWSKGDEV